VTRKLFWALILGGAIAGLVDIVMAAAIYGAPLDAIARSIARGLIGASARQGGVPATLLGVVLQAAMGSLIALIYGVASLKLPILTRRWATFGVLYGFVVFFVMNWVVVPLSAVHAQPKFASALIVAENILAMIAFSLIITWFAHRGASAAKAPAAD
jgi:hypothetical protein